MLFGIQLIGILFALVMIYLTFLYFKRDDYGVVAFLFWLGIWAGFLILVTFPQFVYGIMDLLSIERTADFFVAGALLVFSVVIFKLYVSQKNLEKKIETVVRKVAIDRSYRKLYKRDK